MSEKTVYNQSAFTLLVSLFFMWGFITSLNDILIPHLKAVFDLNYVQAQLVQFCFFGAYFIMGRPAGKIIAKVGYKKSIVIALFVMGCGCLLFYPSSILLWYPLFLFALFILASGITILQVAANPYVAILGKPETASSRLNLSQGFNSLAHTLAPLFGAALILQEGQQPDVSTVQIPYLLLGGACFLIGILFLFRELPDIVEENEASTNSSLSPLSFRNLKYGTWAIFFYVGAEVSIGGFLVNFFCLPEIGNLSVKTAGTFVSFYWGGAMVGRFMGAISLSEMSNKIQKWGLMVMVILIAFFVIFMVHGSELAMLTLGLMVVNLIAFVFGAGISHRLLAVFALCVMALLALTITGTGQLAMWSVLGIGLFNSIMWSNIFTLAIKDLGTLTSQGSSYLVMMIVGGALIPVIQGFAADQIGIQLSFIVPLICYGYVLFYGLSGYKPMTTD